MYDVPLATLGERASQGRQGGSFRKKASHTTRFKGGEVASQRRKLFQRRHCNGGIANGMAYCACLPKKKNFSVLRAACLACHPEKKKYSTGGTVTGYCVLPALPASNVNGPLCLPIEALSRGESLTGFRTTRCLPCLPLPEEKLFHGRHCNAVLCAARSKTLVTARRECLWEVFLRQHVL